MGRSLLTACCPYKYLPGQRVPRAGGPEGVPGCDPEGPAPVILGLLRLKMSLRGAVLALQWRERLDAWICDPHRSAQYLLPV